MAKKTTPALLDVPVNFGNVSIGDKTARIGISIDRAEMTIAVADKNLCGKRLSGRLVSKPTDEHPDQTHLLEVENSKLEGTFDVKGISITTKAISAGLSFSLEGLDYATLGHFAKRRGELVVYEFKDLPEQDGDKNGEAE